MTNPHEILRWRERHAEHEVVAHELPTGGAVLLPELGAVTAPRRILRGFRCVPCAEVLWLDELRLDEPFT